MRRLLAATFLISAVAIGYEILLMRVLSIVQWHHFAYMIISLALLGYGASGTFIAVFRSRLEHRFESAYSLCATLFSITLVLSYLVAGRVSFNPLEIVWDPRQFLRLAQLYMIFFIPFFFAAVCVGLAFVCRHRATGRIYFADLFGAGIGAILIIIVLFVLHVQQALVLLALIALGGAVLMSTTMPSRRPVLAAQFLWAVLLLAGIPQTQFELRVSPFKGLSQALQVVDSEVLSELSSPLGLLTVVDSPTVPFRYAPGLSFNALDVPPDQLAVFTDADAMSVITKYDGDASGMTYLGDVIAALPYRLFVKPRVLILGGGGGSDALLALHHGASNIDVIELNPLMTELVAETHKDFAGHLYDDPRITVHTREARGFVARSEDKFDLIHIGLLDSFGASGTGVHALNESYLYTVEAFQDYIARTRQGGVVAITRWIKLPPRDSLKLFATAIAALRASGVKDPASRLVLLRSWNTSLLLVKNGAYTVQEVESIREFSQRRSFDLAWVPGIADEDANRYNLLDEPYLYRGARELLGNNATDFVNRYKFHIVPATDDRPYYFHFFKWGTLPEVLALRDKGGVSLIEWGYLVLVATLIQAIIAGIGLILVPLFRVRADATRSGFGAYFLLLGLAFLFIEMAFIQKFILFLSHPLYSVAVILSGFLVFAGVGSATSTRLAQALVQSGRHPVDIIVMAIAFISIAYLVCLPIVFEYFMGSADSVRIAVSITLIAPLAFFMGMPFPLGLSRVAVVMPEFIPWAWGINGFASVISAILATVLAIEFGFSAVFALAVFCYLLAARIIRHA